MTTHNHHHVDEPYSFLDRDDFEFEGKEYRAFACVSELERSKTFEHVSTVTAIEDVSHGERDPGWDWWIRFSFLGEEFVLFAWHHGTSTEFHVLNWDCDDQILLALIGCFVPVIYAPVTHVTQPPGTDDLLQPRNIFLYFLFGMIGAFIAMFATLHTALD